MTDSPPPLGAEGFRRDARICFFGDSLTLGVGDEEGGGWVGRLVARASRSGYELTGYNLGIRLETSTDVACRFVDEAERRLNYGDRHAVVFAFGVNDAAEPSGNRRVGRTQTVTRLHECVHEARARDWSVCVVGPAPVGDKAHNERIRDLTQTIDEACGSLGLPFVDLMTPLAAEEKWMQRVAARDGFHPDSAGYEQLADLIWPTFNAWLRQVEG
jgi:acyl-CoA thioesterase-1